MNFMNQVPGLNQNFAGGGINGTFSGGGFVGNQMSVNSADAQYFHDLMKNQNSEIVQLRLAATKQQSVNAIELGKKADATQQMIMHAKKLSEMINRM